MIFTRYRDLFDACLPAFWPWLWLQLAILLAHKAADGRDRLIMVTWWGRVCVLALGDDPNADRPWYPADLRAHVRPLALAIDAYNMPANGPQLVAACCIQPGRASADPCPARPAKAAFRFPTGLSPP